jgi:aminoglycoside 2'-N-acetyltransferase I
MRPADAIAMRAVLDAAFADDGDGFDDDDWAHGLGGLHVVAEERGEIVACAAVVARTLEIGGSPIVAGYVEAVAARPDRQGAGHGTAVMRVVDEHIRSSYALGALGTGAFHFYERLGWRRWPGPTAVRRADGRVERTPDEDGYVMILRTPHSPPLDLTALISCDWRPGDVW